MARPATNPSARLARLDAARPKLAGLKRGEILSAIPMAQLLGVGWPALREWCNTLPGFAASGAFFDGGNGVKYEFQPKKTLDFLTKHFRGVLDRQAADSRRISKAVGVTLPAAETPSLAETKDLVNLTLTVVAAADRQGLYVLASDAADFLSGYNRQVVDGIMGVKTKVDPNGNLPPAVRKRVDEYLRSVATEVNLAARKAIGDYRARTRQAGVGR